MLSLPYHVSMTDLLTDLAPFIGSALGGAAVAGVFWNLQPKSRH